MQQKNGNKTANIRRISTRLRTGVTASIKRYHTGHKYPKKMFLINSISRLVPK